MTGSVLLASSIHLGQWKFTGSFAMLNLIAATTNALNGALLARRPDHYQGFTVVGILLMALMGGIGGGMTRDVLLNMIPSALLNPPYIVLCLLAGIVGYRVAFKQGQLFREGLFQFMTSFSLPWYAIVGAQAGEMAHLPIVGVLALAVIGPTAGRFYIDITCGVPPKQFIRGEWFVATALLTGVVWVICDAAGLNAWWSAGISFVIGFALRVIALYRGWEEPLAKEPAGVYKHPHGRPLLGRKIAGKSHRELKDLGLHVKHPATSSGDQSAGS
jgi:uncharacterized membrane protein YeiH